jgi:hypothetical protein
VVDGAMAFVAPRPRRLEKTSDDQSEENEPTGKSIHLDHRPRAALRGG